MAKKKKRKKKMWKPIRKAVGKLSEVRNKEMKEAHRCVEILVKTRSCRKQRAFEKHYNRDTYGNNVALWEAIQLRFCIESVSIFFFPIKISPRGRKKKLIWKFLVTINKNIFSFVISFFLQKNTTKKKYNCAIKKQYTLS